MVAPQAIIGLGVGELLNSSHEVSPSPEATRETPKIIITCNDAKEAIQRLLDAPGSGALIKELRQEFRLEVEDIDITFEIAGLNRHGWEHTQGVTAWALAQMELANIPEVERRAAGTASIFHDIGNRFPPDLALGGKNSDLMKKALDPHPQIGAELYVHALRKMHAKRSLRPHFGEEWDYREWDISHDAILQHSNGSFYDPEKVSLAAKLVRLEDKMDIDERRVYESHMLRYREAVERKHGLVMNMLAEARQASMLLLSDPAQYHALMQQKAEAVHTTIEQEVDAACEHRLVPYAIVGKQIEIDLENREYVYRYFVDIDRVARQIGAYTRACFLEDATVYDKGFRRGAEVVKSLFERMGNTVLSEDEEWMKVAFTFGKSQRGQPFEADGSPDVVRAYKPLLS